MRHSGKTKEITTIGVLFALAMVLSVFESVLFPPTLLPAGVKVGLSNIVVMYLLLYKGGREAMILSVLKAIFVLLTRGVTAGILSFSGGVFSVLIMVILIKSYKNCSYLLISVFGAVAHNIAQLIAASAVTGSFLLRSYAPVLVISGIAMGAISAVILKAVLPLIYKLDKN